jgi:hypothetical protein
MVSFSGGIAAEMATMTPGDVAKLVAPMGINPPEGDILDQAIISYIDYARAGTTSVAEQWRSPRGVHRSPAAWASASATSLRRSGINSVP